MPNIVFTSSEQMPNQVDRDFSGASAWENVDIDAYDETDDLTITASAADQYCRLPVASAPMIVGVPYILSVDVANLVSSFTIQSFDGAQTLGQVTGDGAGTQIAFIAATAGGLRIVADATDSSADFDNFSLIPAFTFAGGRKYPVADPIEVNVVTDYSEGRQLYAYDKGVVEQFFNLDFVGVADADHDNFAAWLENVAVGPLNTFTFTDENEDDHTVRLMDTKDPFTEVFSGQWSGVVTLREEI